LIVPAAWTDFRPLAATAKPYPVELVKPRSQCGKLDFDHFNEAVNLSAPTNTVDLPQASG
jgi:hypothetical protein